MSARSTLLALVAIAAASCARPPFDPASMDARTLRAAEAPGMHAIAFPPRGTSRPARAPLVVMEPILWRRDLLLRDGGLVSWLEDDGFPVWLVGADGAPEGTRAQAEGVARMVTALARATRVDRVDVLATGLSGAAAMLALEPLTATSSPMRVGHVAFLGAPLDEAYPGGALAPRVAGASLAFRDRGALAWLGAVPPEDPTDARPARERFAFAARFADLPVLFVVGKRDGIAPSESVFPAFTLWGRDAPDRNAVPKGIFLAGRENGLDEDADAFDLLDGKPTAIGAWDRIASFLSAGGR